MATGGSEDLVVPPSRMRHKRRFPRDNRAEREIAVQQIVDAHVGHATQMLVVARSAAVTARAYEGAFKLMEWARVLAKGFRDLEYPGRMGSRALSLRLDDGSRIDLTRVDMLAKRVQQAVGAMAELANRLADPLTRAPNVEFIRDADILAGAALLKYAEAHEIGLTPTDFATVAVAIGLDAQDEDPQVGKDRWRKKMPKIRKAARNVQVPSGLEKTFDEIGFYDPL